MKRKKMIYIICLIVVVLFFVRLYIDHNLLRKTFYEIVSAKIPKEFDGYKILQLSDLHSKDFNGDLLIKINEEKPDIIVMTGDMVSSNHVDYSVFFDLAQQLVKKYEVYYIKGNHEGRLESKKYEIIDSVLKSYGIKVLDNEKVILEKEHGHINLYGMWCNQRYYSRADEDKEYVVKEKTVTKLLGNSNKEEYNILLMHTPTYFPAYEKWGADLTLSGHVHAGLVRIPCFGGVFSPDRKLFPKYCYGKYEINDSKLIISAGLSRGETGFRLFNRPEIVIITLRSGDGKN